MRFAKEGWEWPGALAPQILHFPSKLVLDSGCSKPGIAAFLCCLRPRQLAFGEHLFDMKVGGPSPASLLLRRKQAPRGPKAFIPRTRDAKGVGDGKATRPAAPESARRTGAASLPGATKQVTSRRPEPRPRTPQAARGTILALEAPGNSRNPRERFRATNSPESWLAATPWTARSRGPRWHCEGGARAGPGSY